MKKINIERWMWESAIVGCICGAMWSWHLATAIKDGYPIWGCLYWVVAAVVGVGVLYWRDNK